MLHDMAIQSVKTKSEGETQTFCPEMRNQWSQYEARKDPVVSNDELEKKFASIIPLVNLALQQNELVNVFDGESSKIWFFLVYYDRFFFKIYNFFFFKKR